MKFDIIIIGGGHAGIEAAYIASRKMRAVLMITSQLDLIGQMSCNPSIGGIAKGNIVREIDALGGVMARVIDEAGIHFKMLNSSKGSAVWGNRAQADKSAYRRIVRQRLEQRENIFFLQGLVKKLTCNSSGVTGVIMDSGEWISAKAVILTAGTFLNGMAHIGLENHAAGRTGEPPSLGLTESIAENGITYGRLKTGTSPRIDGRTVDFSKMTAQLGDENPWPFSFSTEKKVLNKAVCWIGKTTEETHKIIYDNLNRSPLYTGKISSIGPRYCPSIEDKVVRFGERDGHTLFLEPESLEHNEMYLNGLSTSLPFDVQIKMVKSIKGMENASIIRPGYGIEYDFFQPLQLKPTLESKVVENLYFAGQVNGTSGYEEAASQGLMAGINATQKLLGEEELVLGRETSYIGVLIDDLITRGTDEPYRMFTSRAEYRLILRQDNSDERLMPIAFRLGFLPKEIYEKRKVIWEKKDKVIEHLKNKKIKPENWNKDGRERLSQTISAAELLKRPDISIDTIFSFMEENRDCSEFEKVTIESDIKYEGFIRKQYEEIERLKKIESTDIPNDINYEDVRGLLTESKVKLKRIQPRSLGQASRIPGLTPADISLLALYISKYRKVLVSRETMGSGV